ncbi:MAG: DsrE/DsrF/DrsH-like family protein [Candidatus Caldarchaeum sp.]
MSQQEVHIVLVSDEPSRVYPAFQLAIGVASIGLKAQIYCTQKALNILRKGKAVNIQLPGYPPFDKVLRDAVNIGVKVFACAVSRDVLTKEGITEETVEEGVGLEDLGLFLKQALPAAKNGGIVSFI